MWSKYGFIIFITLFFEFDISLCGSVQSCTLINNSYSKNGLLKRITLLQGKKYEVQNQDSKYMVSICSDVAEKLTNVSVIKTTKDQMQILALYNYTDIIGGDSWVLLTYGNGSMENATRVKVMIMCNSETDDHLKFEEESSGTYIFQLTSKTLCPKVIEPLSNGSVFCIILLTSAGLYLLIGIAYRRMVGGAKGLEQIPHYDFWKEFGNLQADGCNFVCRRDKQEESWRRLTNNFNDPQDDAMLRP